ncbi:hypothetical protein EJV47_26455 [Hymenobacter gummosus]|uniref:Copper-binding protein MbnP-like domain-containing protein n=1 Tax=Hymenobacter gummosus TaxID=1776032 RepID=A0A431TVA8_9BACT|nr:hypothetical protein EJV47_26455 [Hymenobacter gummosus]
MPHTPPDGGIEVHVEPVFGAQPLVLDAQACPTTHNGPVVISACLLYLSALRLTYTGGSSYVQPRGYHLIDVGVDNAANVAGVQGSGLDPARGMYWAWHSGYVNAKLEGTSPTCPGPRHKFEWHISGYQQPYSSLRRVELAAPVRKAATPLRVQADLALWLSRLRLSLLNALGQVVRPAVTVSGGRATVLDVRGLAAGRYFLWVEGAGFAFSEKIEVAQP